MRHRSTGCDRFQTAKTFSYTLSDHVSLLPDSSCLCRLLFCSCLPWWHPGAFAMFWKRLVNRMKDLEYMRWLGCFTIIRSWY